mmetsp:Transcript_34404/g.58284  ORF Transcript_34404/g.58284 Transcript_34404/m.58284 type:complete len:1120 (-) Transcript_34404:101-3460(-)
MATHLTAMASDQTKDDKLSSPFVAVLLLLPCGSRVHMQPGTERTLGRADHLTRSFFVSKTQCRIKAAENCGAKVETLSKTNPTVVLRGGKTYKVKHGETIQLQHGDKIGLQGTIPEGIVHIQTKNLQSKAAAKSLGPLDVHEKFRPNAFVWKSLGNSLLYLKHGVFQSKIAGFDFDGTLVHARGGSSMALQKSDYIFPTNVVIQKIRRLFADGYGIVIFTNQNGIKGAHQGKRASTVKWAIEQTIRRLEVPVDVFMATQKDSFRKGIGTRMWQKMKDIMEKRRDKLGDDVAHQPQILLDKSLSLFVGDAAGRRQDHSDSDRKFAESVGIKFLTPEECFGESKVDNRVEVLRAFEKDSRATLERGMLYGRRLKGPLMVIMCGPQGAGKSTFCLKMIKSNEEEDGGWVQINQDTIRNGNRGTIEMCLKRAKNALMEGRSVLIDRMHLVPSQRLPFLKIAKDLNVKCHAVVLLPSAVLASNRVLTRKNHAVFGPKGAQLSRLSHAKLVVPRYEEGFKLISVCTDDKTADRVGQLYSLVNRAARRDTATSLPDDQSATTTVVHETSTSTSSNDYPDSDRGKIAQRRKAVSGSRKRQYIEIENVSASQGVNKKERSSDKVSAQDVKEDLSYSTIATTTPSITETTPAASSAGTFRLLKLSRKHGLPPSANEMSVDLRGMVRADDIVQPEWVIIANYMINIPWLLQQWPELHAVPKVLIFHGRSDDIIPSQLPENFQSFCMEPEKTHRIRYGVFHTKSFLIGFATEIRVVVHTANLIPGDFWNKSQGSWEMDFPLKQQQQSKQVIGNERSPNCSDFEEDLMTYMATYKVRWRGSSWRDPVNNDKIRQLSVDSLRRYDYSKANVRLIGSAPGWHRGNQLHLFGHAKLRSILGDEKFSSDFDESNVVAQFSSLGSLSQKWLADFKKSMSAGKKTLNDCADSKMNISSVEKLQIIWPTVEEVRTSLEGYAAGGSIPGYEKNVIKPFLQGMFHKWATDKVHNRRKAAPHIKTFLRYSKENPQKLAWMLLTSHNLSKAAWGEFQNGRSGLQFFIRHWELGVLFLPSLNKRSTSPKNMVTTAANPTKGEISIKFPLPYSLPPIRYEGNDKPWIWDIQHIVPDNWGRRSIQG